jgi:hypothetical protein
MTALQNSEYKINNMDFYNDWIEELRQSLVNQGHQVVQSASGLDICKQYFGLLHRRVAPQPRKVVVSQELKCPKEFEQRFDNFKTKVVQGDNLNPHLSREIKKPDKLLNEWGIHHFHLNTIVEADGFVKRSGPILFALVTSDTFYCLTVMEHGSKYPEVWSDQQIIEIIHSNWPILIEQYNSGLLTMDKVTRTERNQFRKSNVNTFVEVGDGTIYSLPGGGSMLDGSSMKIFMTHQQNAYLLSQKEQQIRDNIVDIASNIQASTGYKGNDFNFQVMLFGEQIFVCEHNSKSHKFLFEMFNPFSIEQIHKATPSKIGLPSL